MISFNECAPFGAHSLQSPAMARTVLITTQPGDVHAYAVAIALQQRGAVPVLWHTSDFPHSGAETAEVAAGGLQVRVRGADGAEFDPATADVVWRRRPAHHVRREVLHAADQEYVSEACRQFRDGLFSVVNRGAFWVNPNEAARTADRKLYQQEVANSLEFRTPETIFSNDPQRIREFIARNGGSIVFKPFRGIPWSDDENVYVPYTSRLRADQLVSDELLQASPGIYQAEVTKAYELRVTVIGERVFAAKINSQDTINGRLDWRKAYSDLRMEPYDLPPRVAGLCCDVVRQLGLVFGCIDLIVTPDAEYVFLEVNQMGQFLFVERYAGIPLLDAFASFLLEADTRFTWAEDKVTIRYNDIAPQIEAMWAGATRCRAEIPARTWVESSTLRPDAVVEQASPTR